MAIFKYQALRAKQASGQYVFTFIAPVSEIFEFSDIERIGRDEDGELLGFQRHQVSNHIKEIRTYLSDSNALLPNAVIIAFIEGVSIKEITEQIIEITIDTSKCKPGYIVDGQQRLTALSGANRPEFELFISGLICKDYNQLRQQFVLINNTRPLPRTLIYELLPTIDGLPERFTSKKFSARIIDRLNYSKDSVLQGQIKQHTCPKGILSDTALQKIVSNSTSDGALRKILQEDDYEIKSYLLLNEFFSAVIEVFKSEWIGMVPKNSRLKHGSGLVAMGFVMEYLYSDGARTKEDFKSGLMALKPYTNWTTGTWNFSITDIRPWNGIQNTPTDTDILANYLVRSLKKALRKQAI
ncbi:DGQHR domain-containing protein DpdB [Acinetobacter baumannii]